MSLFLDSRSESYSPYNINNIYSTTDSSTANNGYHTTPNISNVIELATSTVLESDIFNSTPSPPVSGGQKIQVLKLVVWGIIGSILAVLGFLGNTLSIVVLQRRQMRSSTSYYLFSLAIYDNCILLGMMVYFCLPALSPYAPFLENYQSISSLTIPVGYPLSLTAQMGSIYTCVGFTVERFIAVCRPLHVANTCTKSRTLRAILLIFLWSLIYNIPRFFHYQVHYPEEDPSLSQTISPTTPASANVSIHEMDCRRMSSQYPNLTCVTDLNSAAALSKVLLNSSAMAAQSVLEETFGSEFNSTHSTPGSNISPSRAIRYRETDFGSDPTFQHLYLIYSQLFFMFLLPFLIILIMNIGLIRAVKGSKSMQQSMCASARKEHNLTVMLIAVIVVFLVCQFPTIIDNILVAMVGEAELQKSYSYWCFYIFCTVMVEINAASNFLLYCFFGKKFRMMLLNILGLKRKQQYVAYRSTVCKSRTNGTRIYEMEVSVM